MTTKSERLTVLSDAEQEALYGLPDFDDAQRLVELRDKNVGLVDEIAKARGRPKSLRVDNGPEFISKDLDLWAYAHDVTLDFSRPGKPTDNGFIEAFNSKLRSECLNAHWFMTLADAGEKLEDWRRHYNEARPHSAKRRPDRSSPKRATILSTSTIFCTSLASSTACSTFRS